MRVLEQTCNACGEHGRTPLRRDASVVLATKVVVCGSGPHLTSVFANTLQQLIPPLGDAHMSFMRAPRARMGARTSPYAARPKDLITAMKG